MRPAPFAGFAPDPGESRVAGAIGSKLSSGDKLVLVIDGWKGRSEEFILPSNLSRAIRVLLEKVSAGEAIALSHAEGDVGIDEAGVILDVPAAHATWLSDAGEFPSFERDGRRMARLADVLAYRMLRDDQYRALDEITALSQEMGLYDDVWLDPPE